MTVLITETNEACLQTFVDEYHFRLGETTLYNYQISIRQLLAYCQKPYVDILSQDIRNWMHHLKEQGAEWSTIKQRLVGLRLFFDYCVEEKKVPTNPVHLVPIPKVPDSIPQYLTQEQLEQLRTLVSGNLKQRAVIELLYATGVRLGELINMKKEDIFWSERIIQIPKGKGKKERIVLFTRACEKHLKAYLETRNDDLAYVIVNRWAKGPMTSRGIQHWFQGYQKEMQLMLTPHTLRHTFAAHLAMKGMSLSAIQVLLGHDNPAHTHLYARLHAEAQKQKYDEWM